MSSLSPFTRNGQGQTCSAVENATGMVFNVQHFSIQDGPGIRTTVFLKGCPLHCPWCSNPESMNPGLQVKVSPEKCRACGSCIALCENGALSLRDGVIALDGSRCSRCMLCAEACRYGGISVIGAPLTTDDAVNLLMKDRIFYDRTGGGVTLSGGEPLLQHGFILELLKRLHDQGVHTALDTTGHAPWDILRQVLEYVDLLLYDIKHLDTAKHLEATGKDNDLIIENLIRCSGRTEIWIRTPLIRGFNDDFAFTDGVVDLAGNIHASRCYFLPFHRWGEHKYARLGMKSPYGKSWDFTAGELDAFRKRYRSLRDFVFFEKA